MQMLETIQEYVPFKHSFVYFSSWIGSKYNGTQAEDEHTDEQNNEENNQEQETMSNNQDKKVDIPEEGNNEDNLDSASVLPDGDLPTEMETSFIDPLPIPQNGLENGRDSSESALSKNEAGGEIISNGNINVNVSASRSSLENTPKSDAPLFSDIPVEDGSCYSDSENDQFRWDFKKQSRDNGRLRPASNLATLPMFLKRRKKKKRRGNTWSDHRATKVRCDCAFSGEDLCLIHTKSHSESDVATPFHRIGEDYLADLSDISVASFSLADDDSSSESYVDIDLHNLRKFLRDSDSVSQSERSLDLSSEWSELHRTMSEPSITDGYYSLAEECRESDIPDTASDFSQDSRTHTKKTRRLHYPRRLKRLPVMGHHVNESYLENECFCCHCSIM